MPTSTRAFFILAALLLASASAGCQTAAAQRNIDLAKTYRSHVKAMRIDEARAMLGDDARIWFEDRDGEGRALDPAPGTGPWAGWDRHFRSNSEVIEWTATADSATAIVRESNEYYELLERGPQRSTLTYFVAAGGRISGLLIQGGGPRPMGRTDEFLAWAHAHEPDEIAKLMPDGEVDPRGDHPQRFRELLNRWRAASGLPPIR